MKFNGVKIQDEIARREQSVTANCATPYTRQNCAGT